MFELFLWITENGLQHFIPLLILIGIFVLLAEKVNTQIFSWSAAREYFFRMNISFSLAAIIITGIHILEFLAESQKLFSFPGGTLGIEVAELVLLYAAIFFFFYGMGMLKRIQHGRFYS